MKGITTILSILFCSTFVMGQVVDRTEERAKEKTNQRVDQKIDKGIDKGLDAIEGLFSKKKKTDKNEEKENDSNSDSAGSDSQNNQESADQSAAMMSKLFGGDVDVEDSYSFDHNMILNIQTWDKKGKEQDPMDTKMYFSETEPNFGMEVNAEGSESFMIYDMQSYQMVTLINTDGQKMGMAMKFDPANFEDQMEKTKEENIKYSFEKTGKTKVISGYDCEEYVMTSTEGDEEWDYSYWVTDDIEANWMGYMSNMMATNKKMSSEYELPEDYPQGAMIQIIGESKKNEEKTITTVKEFNKNQPKSFSTEGYQFMNMPGMGGGN